MTEQEFQLYSFTLTIQSIKMKVKFPCKMTLQLKGDSLTHEVTPNESNKFIFNKEITLKDDSGKHSFQVTVNLTTEKGGKYIAGVFRLHQAELIHQEGQLLIVPLAKCLDSEATCELRLDQVTSEKVLKKLTLEKNFGKSRGFKNQLESPLKSTDKYGTKSQFYVPNRSKTKRQWEQHKRDDIIPNSQRNKSPIYSKRFHNMPVTHVEKNYPEFHVDPVNRDKLIEAEVYKEGYQKLKDKYKRQAENAKHEQSKRVMLQNNENNLKMEIMRMKVKCEQQDTKISEKNSKIRQLQLQLTNLQKKQLDLQYLKEQNSNQQHMVKILQDTIKTLNRDNDDLKTLNRERFEAQQIKINDLRLEIENLKINFEKRQAEFQRQIQAQMDIITQKQAEIKSIQSQLQREKTLVDELERGSQNKVYEYERSFQFEKTSWKGKLDEAKAKIEKVEREKAQLEEQIKRQKQENEKSKNYIIRIEYDKKILIEETDGLKNQMLDFKALKEKHQQLSRDHKLLNQDKNHLQKQLQKTINSKELGLVQLTKQNQEQVEYYKKIFKEADEKLKASQTKNIQIESQLQQKKNQLEKAKRNNDSLTKELAELKEKQKSLNNTLKAKETELSNISLDLNNLQHKHKNEDNMSRIEQEKLKEQINKLKLEFQSQNIKNTQINENNANLGAELSKVKLQLQFTQEKLEKDTQNFEYKVESLESTIKNYEQKIEEFNGTIKNLKGSEKENLNKIQQFDIEGIKNNEKVQKLNKQIKSLEDKVANTETTVKNKQHEISLLLNSKENLEKKLQENEEKLNSSRNEINTLNGEKKKNEKIIKLLEKDLQESKKESQKGRQTIGSKEKSEEDLRTEIKKSKEDYLKLEMKQNSLKKQYEKFKQNIFDTATSSFNQIPLSQELVSSSVVMDASRRKQSEGLNPADVINTIVSQNKDLKLAMSKMIQQSKMQQGQIERLTQENSANGTKFHEEEKELQNNIQNLQQEITKIYEEKEEMRIQNEGTIAELGKKLQNEENKSKDLLIQVEQLNFTLNSLKLDQNANNQHFKLKYNQYKVKINDLEEKINYITQELEKEELKNKEIDEKLNQMNINYEKERDINDKKGKEIDELEYAQEQLLKLVQEYKRSKKQMSETISELEFKLTTEVQVSQKTKNLLQDEQHKGKELKNFISDLMKQKQQAIKNQLQKSEQIIMLQGSIFQLTREKEMLTNQCERNKEILDEQKENIKKMNQSSKELDKLFNEEKTKQGRTSEKLKQKERQLVVKQENYENLQKIHQQFTEKAQRQISELQNQIQESRIRNTKTTNSLNDRIVELEKSEQQNLSTISKIKGEIVELEENIFMEKKNNDIKSQSQNKLQEEIGELKSRIDSQQITINNLNEEVKEKDETMFQLSGKIYNLQVKIENKEEEKVEKINYVNEDWNCKYENMCEEYENRLELVEKEKEHFKLRLNEKQQQLRKYLAELKDNETENSNIKKILEEKIKRLEDERLVIISTKNNEIQKLSQENKSYFDLVKSKQSDIRRLHHQVEIARSTINKLDFHKKETEEKNKSITKIYQTQLQQVKKKETAYRGMKEAFNKCQWTIEREVRKIIQSNVKRLLSITEQQKIMENMKGLEQSVINIIHSKIEEVK